MNEDWGIHQDEVGDADQTHWEPIEYILIRYILALTYLNMAIIINDTINENQA